MDTRRLLKYKIGLLIIGLFTVALLVVVLVQADATKQDAQTDKLANSMADSLDNYTDTNFTVPDSLRQAGINKTSPYISYTKLSASKYKFCITYKGTSSDFDPSLAVDNLLAGGDASWGSGVDVGDSTYLSIPTSHHKGVNCQTIDIGTDGLGGGLGCGGPIGDPISGSSDDIMCPLQSGGGDGTGGSSDSSLSAGDSQRETDIDALQAHLEASYATNGYYPTFVELNSASWRSTNMIGLDASASCDPSASSTSNCPLASAPQEGAYSYQATDVNGQDCTDAQDCTGYTLTATLSTGTQYIKQSAG